MLKQYIKKSFLFVGFTFGFYITQAQESSLPCGTASLKKEEKSALEKMMVKAMNSGMNFKTSNASMTCVPIKVHDITNGAGGGSVDMESLNKDLASLNYHFKASSVEFYFCNGISVLDNASYYDFSSVDEAALLIDEPAVTNAMNLYLVNSVTTGSGVAAGYAYFPYNGLKSTVSIIDKSVLGNYDNGTTVHEYGHHFNLHHTHEGTENGNSDIDAEHVPRTGANSNCTTHGDFLCDTEADPKGSETNCVYDGGDFDIFGNEYTPPLDNIMSYYSDVCGGRFTPQQSARIAAALSVREAHSAYSLDCPAATVSLPSGLVGALSSGSIDLTWTDNASNEMGYLIERSTTSATDGFESLPLGGTGPNITSFSDGNISSNTTYWYRIKASNGSCNSYSNVAEVAVGLVYCSPEYVSGPYCSNAIISNVTFTGDTQFNNPSSCSDPAYEDYSSTISADVTAGDTYSFSVEKSLAFTRYVQVYVDYNQDGDLDDANEKILLDNVTVPSFTYTGSITIPSTAYNGDTRLRVMMKGLSTVAGPCETSISFGETEDYTLTISGGVDKPVSTGVFSAETLKSKTLTIFPNPANNSITLSFNVAQGLMAEVECKDMTGRVVSYERFQSVSGDNFKTISIQGYPSGIYVFQMKVGEDIYTSRVVKQ